MNVLAFDSVVKRFGQILALDRVSLAIDGGTTLALLGPNGAGKSTLAALSLGLRAPDTGTVRICGRDPRDHQARRAVGAMPQDTLFPQTLRVGELVEFVASHFGAPMRVEEALAEFGLAELAARPAGALSVGQRRRLALTLAFVGRPDLLVLDEPTAALDAEGRGAVWSAVRAAHERGAAVVVATHQLDEADAVATRIVALDRGRVVADGTPAEVKNRAGATRIRYRANGWPPPVGATVSDGWVTLDVPEPGVAIRQLVDAGRALGQLEVRPLTLEEALATSAVGR
jgi:ABC-2 type transport system ATP-binding protein